MELFKKKKFAWVGPLLLSIALIFSIINPLIPSKLRLVLYIILIISISLTFHGIICHLKTDKDETSKITNPNTDERVQKIFRQLKKDGYIKKKRKLKRSFRFQAGFFGNILYPGEMLERYYLSDDTIRFVLLHEEGHLSKFKLQRIFQKLMIAYVPIWLLSPFYFSFRPMQILPLLTICFFNPITIVIIILIMSKTVFRNEESQCDYWAAKIVKEHYGYRNPSHLLKELRNWMNQAFDNADHLDNMNRKLIRLIAPHPSVENRIKSIELLDEDY